MRIRKFRDEDARQCYAIIKKCFLSVNKDEDSPKTIKNLIEGNKPSKLIKKSKTRHYYVAVQEGKILGMGGFTKDGHLHTFFVEPNIHGKGIGKKIMTRTLSDARKKGLKKIFCNSSLYAERFYKKCGFKRIKKMTVPYKGDFLNIIRMERRLN